MKKYLTLLLVFFVSAASLCAAPSLTEKVAGKAKKPGTLFSGSLTGELHLLLEEHEAYVSRPAVRIGNDSLLVYGSQEDSVASICVAFNKKQCALPEFSDIFDDGEIFFVHVKREDMRLNNKMQIVPLMVAPANVISRLEDVFIFMEGKKHTVYLGGESFYNGNHVFKVQNEGKSVPVGTPLFATYINERGTKQGPALIGFKTESETYEFPLGKIVFIGDVTPIEREQLEDEARLKTIQEELHIEKEGQEYNQTQKENHDFFDGKY